MKDFLLIPNILTSLRIILLFPVLFFLENGEKLIPAILLVILFLTDFFDGLLARKLNQASYLGAILDPIADKIAVLVLFSYIYYRGLCPGWYYLLILTRDIAQLLSVPVLLVWKKIFFKVKPKLLPKIGTALNFIILGGLSLPIFFLHSFIDVIHLYIVFPLLLVSGCIEIYILITYIPRFFQIYKGTHDTFE